MQQPWSPGDDPTTHPMWPIEIELERGMLRQGADRFRDRVVSARERQQMSDLSPVRQLIDEWLPKVAGGVVEWRRSWGPRRGARGRSIHPLAYPYLRKVDHYTAALVALRAITDGLTTRRDSVTRLACTIGRNLEHELMVEEWEAKAPALFNAQRRKLDRDGATSQHRAAVNVNRFNALLKDGKFGLNWTPWSQEVHFRVGQVLVDIVMRYTGWFEVIPDPEHQWNGGKKRPSLVLAAKPELVEWLARALDRAEVMNPVLLPTVVPPKRWEGTRSGGYWTPYVNGPRLIRFKAAQEEQRDRAADEYEALDMPNVYEAVHVLQETPWKVNTRVLDVAREMWRRDYAVAGLPLLGENMRGKPLPEKPAEDAGEEAWRRWRKEAHAVHVENRKRLSAVRATSRTILVADQYRDYGAIYFPHQLDFRGRCYPTPVGLNAQGDDLSRGLLAFAEGLPITDENGGAGWLAVQLASMWGNDKVSFEDRIAWVEEREGLWRRIAADPIGNYTLWADPTADKKAKKLADKPWQSLAAIFEWVAYLDHGEGYVSHLPIMVDGTCNGIQHLAAMTRDAVAGEYVNLVPGEKPRDIYKEVANRLQERFERIEKAGGDEGGKASWWLDLVDRDIPRAFTKRQVMVLPYGATKDAFYTYTREWLDGVSPLPITATDPERKWRNSCLSFAVNHLWDIVGVVVSGGMRVMKWLQDCARACLEGNQPIFWVAPSGFVVRHFYGIAKERQIRCLLDGSSVQLRLKEYTKDLDTQHQLRGIAPNFVHSLDASALVTTILKAKAEGVRSFVSIHDAYGTHAANMWPLYRMLREAFVETHETDMLGHFRMACQRVLVDYLASQGKDPLEASQIADEKLPPPITMGDLDLKAVLESDYFFA